MPTSGADELRSQKRFDGVIIPRWKMFDGSWEVLVAISVIAVAWRVHSTLDRSVLLGFV